MNFLEYAFDAIMLKFMYFNQTSGAFVNGTVSYSADLSRLVRLNRVVFLIQIKIHFFVFSVLLSTPV